MSTLVLQMNKRRWTGLATTNAPSRLVWCDRAKRGSGARVADPNRAARPGAYAQATVPSDRELTSTPSALLFPSEAWEPRLLETGAARFCVR